MSSTRLIETYHEGVNESSPHSIVVKNIDFEI